MKRQMGIVVIVIIIIILAICYYSVSKLIAPKIARITIKYYLTWWMACLFLSSLNLYGLNKVADGTYLLLLINVVFFIVGYTWLSTAIGRRIRSNKGLIQKRDSREFHSNILVNIILAVLLLYLLYYYRKYQIGLKQFGPSQARNIRYYVGPVFSSTFEILFFNYIIEAVSYFLIINVAYCIAFGSKNRVLLFLSIIDLIIYTLIGSARVAIVEECIILLYMIIIRTNTVFNIKHNENRNGNDNKKMTLSFIMSTLALMLILIMITAKRLEINELNLRMFLTAGKEFVSECVIYITGSFRALDYSLHNGSKYGLQFGRMTFAGIDELIGYMCRWAGLDFKILNNEIAAITSQQIDIGSGKLFNALYTCVFRFYFDFKLIGIIWFSMIFGFSLRYSVFLFEKDHSFYGLALMAFIFVSSIYSVQNLTFSSPSSVIYITIVIVLKYFDKRHEPYAVY